MSEYRSCEDYVLKRLEQAENELEAERKHYEDTILFLNQKIGEYDTNLMEAKHNLETLKNLLRNQLIVSPAFSTDGRYITMSMLSDYDQDDYNELKRLIPDLFSDS